MLLWVFNLWAFIFGHRAWSKFNKFLYNLGLRGLGVLNYTDIRLSGESHFLSRLAPLLKNGVAFDVGANEGAYSSKLHTLYPSLTIFCFEPHPETYRRLAKRVTPLEIKPFNLGLGEKSGGALLYDYSEFDGSSHASLYDGVIVKLHQKPAQSHQVDISTLDEFATKQKVEFIDLLKIDTEGNELSVLKGAENLISQGRIKIIQFEFNEMNIFSGARFKDFWDLLSKKYFIFRLLPKGFLPISRYNPLDCEVYAYQNFVACIKGLTILN